MATFDNSALVREVMDAYNEKDVERALRVCAPDAHMTVVPFGQTLSFADDFRNWATAFPDGKIEFLSLLAQGDFVVAECYGRGTNSGPLEGPEGRIPPTNRRGELRFMNIYECRDGKIIGARMYFDSLSLMAQLGLAHPPPTRVVPAAEQPALRH